MKATGIVRRIDDLGRVVIPKEIRRTLRIREGDPLEIFVDNEGEVILKKYSPINELGHFAKEYAESIAEHSGHLALITDRDTVIAVAGGSKKAYLNKNIGSQLRDTMDERQTRSSQENESEIVEDQPAVSAFVAAPIIANGDPIGTLVIATNGNDEAIGEVEQKVVETAAGFLGKQMEQ